MQVDFPVLLNATLTLVSLAARQLVPFALMAVVFEPLLLVDNCRTVLLNVVGIIQGMGCHFLTKARLTKKFWQGAANEAVRRLNLLPVATNANNPRNPNFWATPFKAFYAEKPDYCVLFPFGCYSSFHCKRDENHSRSSLNSQGLLGIDVDCSKYTNDLIFYNPELDSFCTSADYNLDCSRMLGSVFPSIVYNGGLITSALSSKANGPSKYDMGETVYVQDEVTNDVSQGTVLTPPIRPTKVYTIVFEDGTEQDVKPENIYNEHNVPSNGKPSVSLGFFKPP